MKVDLDKAKDMVKSGKWYVYELNPKSRHFCLLDNFSGDDLDGIGYGNFFLLDSRIKEDLPYDYICAMTAIDNGDEDDEDLQSVFNDGGDPVAFECLACGGVFGSQNELLKHQYESGHDGFSEPVAKDPFGAEVCKCIGELKKISKVSLVHEHDDECWKMVSGIYDSIKSLYEKVIKCSHK